jgi:hypothetical protein
MCNEYAYDLAKALTYPELTVEFAADVINGYVYGSDIWDEVCTLVGGWCNDANVFHAWDDMGRPDEWEYLPSDYDLERDPARRRSIVANARIWAMAETVADALYDVVNDIVVNDGWKCIPASEIETDMHGIGWLQEGCDALDVYTESYLFKPNGSEN